MRDHITKIKDNFPDGKLRCAVNKGYFQYYSGKQYLGKEQRKYVRKLAQKDYCQQLEKKVDGYIKHLEKLQKLYEDEDLENVYRKLHIARKQLVIPLAKPIEQQIEEFENIAYEPKLFSEEDQKEYYTAKGERVRSKSEKIIADELYRYGIPYKYEYPIILKERNKQVIFYPDFTVMNKRTGKRWILEHLGMMNDAGYSESAMKKLDLYEKNGFLLGKNLLLTHETTNFPLNTNTLKKYIEEYLC